MAGHPTYHVNVFKLKSLREIIWTGGLPHLRGVTYLHVNRPLDASTEPATGTSKKDIDFVSKTTPSMVQFVASLARA